MCGITAYSRNKRTSIPKGRDFAILATHAIESRGRHATGFGWWEDGDDESVYYDKRKGPATKVAHDLGLPKNRMTTMVGHTRHFTLGSPSIYENNHPVVAERIVLVHNGRCENHLELAALADIDRGAAQVDSWALAGLLAADLGADHPTELLELFEGCAAIAWLDANEPGVLHLARMAQRPMTVGWTKRGDLVMSSTRSTLALTSRLTNVAIDRVKDVPVGQYLRVEGGKITDKRKFKVNEPAIAVAEDVPISPSKGRAIAGSAMKHTNNYRAPRLFDAADADWWAEHDRRKAAEREQAIVVSRRDGIDWPTLVPRRGWKID